MLAPSSSSAQLQRIAACEVEIIDKGRGRPLVFLHPAIGLLHSDPVRAGLATLGRLIVPSHPGFGRSELPAGFDSVDDLAFFYLDMLAALDLRDVVLIGGDLGGWIAAEMAVRSTERIGALVLSGAVGIRVGERATPDLADVFALPRAEVERLSFHEPARAALDIASLSDDELQVIARNREAAALYGWSPYMHHPKLRRRLRRIDVPTLVLWGEGDGISPVNYGRAYADAIPGARFEIIPACGHYPHIEQPDAFVARIAAFLKKGAGEDARSAAATAGA